MAKSRDAFRTISEVAEWLDTPAHVLRFWESKFTQVKPVKRAGGRRYYRPDDMALLAGIKTLLHDQGLTIKGAQKLLREKGVKHVAALGADPRSDETGHSADVIELRPVEAAPAPAEPEPPEEDVAEAPPEPPQRVEPTAWDPDDPWPADPVPSGGDGPTLTPLEDTPGTAVFSSSETEAGPEPVETAPPATNAPVAADEPEEVALPFVRHRKALADPPAADVEGAEPEDEPGWRPPPPPAMPDVDAITGTSGMISLVAALPRANIRRKASQVAPIVQRMEALRNRMAAPDH